MDDYGAYTVATQLQGLSNQIGQEKENERARQFNSEEAQKSRDYNTWLLSNQTQLKAQDARMAGLSPAFMNGSLLSSTPSVGSSPSSPNTYYPIDPTLILQSDFLRAQTENVQSQTKKVDSETDRQLIENEYLPQLLQSQFLVTMGDVSLKGSQVHLTDEQARLACQQGVNLRKECERMNKQIELDTAQINNINQDTKLKLIDEFWKSKEYQAIIDKLVSETSLNYTQADDIVKTRASRLMQLESSSEKDKESADIMRKQGFGIDIQNGRMAIQLEMDEKYKEVEKIVDLGGKVLGSITDCLNVASKFTTHKVKTESHSTSNSTVNSTVNSNSRSYNQNENWNHVVND